MHLMIVTQLNKSCLLLSFFSLSLSLSLMCMGPFVVHKLYCNMGSGFCQFKLRYQIILQSSFCLLRFQYQMKVGNSLWKAKFQFEFRFEGQNVILLERLNVLYLTSRDLKTN
jgi:hypothetical protein